MLIYYDINLKVTFRKNYGGNVVKGVSKQMFILEQRCTVLTKALHKSLHRVLFLEAVSDKTKYLDVT